VFGGILRPAALGAALHLVSGFPSRRGIKLLLTRSLWTIHIAFVQRQFVFTMYGALWICFYRVLAWLLQNRKRTIDICQGEEKCNFYNKVPLPDLPLIEFDDTMSIGNSTIDIRRLFFFRLIHLLRVLGVSWLPYITSRIHSALFA
jgi:hypothetical protein